MELTGWDWFVLVIMLLSVGFGIWRGMIRTIFALLAWIVALVGTPLLLPIVSPLIAPIFNLESTWLLAVPMFIVLFLAVRIVGGLISAGLGKAGLGSADRLFGGLLGFARAAIVVAVFALIAKQFGLHEQALWKQSVSRPFMEMMVFWLEPFLPERLSGIQKT
jgi:membrane protein required for colicin V production